MVLLVLLVVGFGSTLVVRSWQDQTHDDLKGLLARLRFFKNESKTIRLVIQGYAGHERPPYGQPGQPAAPADGGPGRKSPGLPDRLRRVQQGSGPAGRGFRAAPQRAAALVPPAPADRQPASQHAEIEKVLPEAMDGLEQLHRQSWEVAQQARQFQDGLHEASPRLHHLQAWGLQGEDFEAAVDREVSLQTALDSIPVAFLTASEEEILAQPDRPAVVSLHQLLNERQPELDGLIAQARAWTGQYQEAAANLAALQSVASAARQQLTAMPQDLLLAEMDARLKKIAGTAKDLDTRLASPEVSQLGSLATEARQTARSPRISASSSKKPASSRPSWSKPWATWPSAWRCSCARWPTWPPARFTRWSGRRARPSSPSCRRNPPSWAPSRCRAPRPRSKNPGGRHRPAGPLEGDG